MRVLLVPGLLLMTNLSYANFSEYCSSSDPGLKRTIDQLKSKLNANDCSQLEEKVRSAEKLDLMNSGITDLRPLSSARKLKVLKVGYDENFKGDVSKAPKVSSLEGFPKLALLNEIDLRNQNITDRDLEQFRTQANLTKLNLSGNNNIKSLSEVRGLVNLSSFEFDCIEKYQDGKPVLCEKSNWDGDLKHLKSLRWLKDLSLKQTGADFKNCPVEIQSGAVPELCQELLNLNPDFVVEKYNAIFQGGVPVCDSVKSVDGKPGYHVAEVTKDDGTKEVLRVTQNTLHEFSKNPDGSYTAKFDSHKRNSKTGEIRNQKFTLKIEPNVDGEVSPITGKRKLQFNLYNPTGDTSYPVAKYDVSASEKGGVAFLETASQSHQMVPGREQVSEGAFFAPNAIRAVKKDGIVHYTTDQEKYEFPKEVIKKIEAETGKRFFKQDFDERNNHHYGNVFSIDEVRELAKQYKVAPSIQNASPWQSCPKPGIEELAAYEISRFEKPVVAYPVDKGNTLEKSERGPAKEISSPNSSKKASSRKVLKQ